MMSTLAPFEGAPRIAVELVTMTGHHVLNAAIPPFGCLPEVLLWGQRVFRLEEPVNLGRPRYREAFVVAVMAEAVERSDTEPPPPTDPSPSSHGAHAS